MDKANIEYWLDGDMIHSARRLVIPRVGDHVALRGGDLFKVDNVCFEESVPTSLESRYAVLDGGASDGQLIQISLVEGEY